MRMWIPESPRWLAIHGRASGRRGRRRGIEERFGAAGVTSGAGSGERRDPAALAHPYAALEVFDTLFRRFRLRTFVGLR